MKTYLITFIGSFFIGGFVSLMMIRSAIKSDKEYALQQFSAVSDKLGTVDKNTQVDKYKYCLHD